MQNVDMGTVIANTLFGFTFSGMLVLLALLAIGALWCTVPFAVFGVKKRLDGIEVAQRSQTEMLIGELKRINDNLRQRVSIVNAAEAPAEQPITRQRFERAETFNDEIDAEMQAAMDAVEQELAARVAPQPHFQQAHPQQSQQMPARPTMRPAPMPARSPAYANAAATMFGQRPPTLSGALQNANNNTLVAHHAALAAQSKSMAGMARPVTRSALQFNRA